MHSSAWAPLECVTCSTNTGVTRVWTIHRSHRGSPVVSMNKTLRFAAGKGPRDTVFPKLLQLSRLHSLRPFECRLAQQNIRRGARFRCVAARTHRHSAPHCALVWLILGQTRPSVHVRAAATVMR